ncbi:MAG: ATP-binding cassette domain-containing protein [Candidatus Bathyarchaeota archaeon]|nr:MAG: ATP-binding cassette domain-containing protein [Candidatus Bathyarchaeota archaeon]
MSVEINDFSITYTWRAKTLPYDSLKNVDLKIKKGEIFGILGPTGAGKSSLLLCLNAIVPRLIPAVVKGDIVVDGLSTSTNQVHDMAQHIGLVLPDPSYGVVSITVEDDIAFGPSNLSLTPEEIRNRVEFALQACRLSGYEQRSTGDLSGGESQSLAIAGVISMMPPVIALDEPITMLDPIGKDRVLEVIKEINKNYNTTIIITEAGGDIEYFAPILDRVAIIKGGEILGVGAPKKVFMDEDLMGKIPDVLPPQVTRFLLDLEPGEAPPLTVAEAEDRLKRLYKSKKIQVKEPRRRRSSEKGKQEPIISIKNLHHVYPGLREGIHALKGISLDIYPGEYVGLIGQNGSGKTTLSYHLVGLLRPTNKDAEVIVDGVDAGKAEIKELINHINYSFQNPDSQLFQETVWGEVSYGLGLAGLSEEEIEKRGMDALKLFKVESHREDPIIRASLDVKRFVAISSLIALEPKILIVDEPTNGLDYEGGKRVLDVLDTLNKSGWTIIIITHNMQLVAEYVRRVIVLKGGEVLMDGPTDEVFSQTDKLKEAFLLPPQVTQLGQRLGEIGVPDNVLSIEEMEKIINKS